MSQERRKFDKEFKLMTVELSQTRENLNELAKELGIRVALIYRWRTEFLDKGRGSFPGHGQPKHTLRGSRDSQAQETAPGGRNGKRYTKKGHQHLLQGRREIHQFISKHSSRFPAREDV